jgi:hypothetical protein
LPTLIKVATTERDPEEADVRRAALEGIALLAANLGPGDERLMTDEKLEGALLTAAGDSDPRTRAVAAVALGVIGGEKNLEKLRSMLEDIHPDVRYNAAARLAHQGDAAAAPVLEEMLDQNEIAGVEIEKSEELRPFKRALITINALRAAGQLAEKYPDADLSGLKAAVEKLLAAGVEGELRIEATSALRQLNARGVEASK